MTVAAEGSSCQSVSVMGATGGSKVSVRGALDSKALRDDLYFDAGCLLALSLVHGSPVSFFSRALFQCLFNYPPNQPLSVKHMTPYTHVTCQVSRIAEAETLDDVKDVLEESWEFMELAGCNRPISRLQEREALVEDLVSFMMITRLQLPLQRFREGLQTLGVFDQVQLFPAVFLSVFCDTAVRLTAQTVDQIFTVNFSEQEERLSREKPVVAFWRNFLQDCEGRGQAGARPGPGRGQGQAGARPGPGRGQAGARLGPGRGQAGGPGWNRAGARLGPGWGQAGARPGPG
ncbi:G2/M phase-specific E3 ubiquitin-protein ligase [Trematomus bernacchii]|uniref:G2/M phase-specific E3 ubiquitin-protein ligase n=1 Tax=Trematomus bernacchii TaxID=40690 RepID=UPI00146E13F6|nr:G2/M phase-specific E3 ubiquitin-protein ligase [Trematomus bernacchii]